MNKEKIKEALTDQKEKKVLHPNGFALASVLIPILERGDNLYILFTKRSKHVKNHEGEVSFPGGVVEKREDPEEAAIRETEEEIGISSDEVEIMGRSPSVRAWTSRYVILPHVGYIETHPVIRVNKSEVQDTFEVPMEFLKKENRKFDTDED
ncbi:hypothetical protein AKJ36_03380, partial [candidate division MSBL1 archaeon SCGC-AAA259I07]